MTGDWVRVLATSEQLQRERAAIETAAARGLVKLHGTHRGVLLVEFLDVPSAAAVLNLPRLRSLRRS